MGLTSSADGARIGNMAFKDRLIRREGWRERLRDGKSVGNVMVDEVLV